jgi:hypothetical protein
MESFEKLVGRELARKDLDELTIYQATELLVDYCLNDPDVESKSITSRTIVDGLYVGVGTTRDEREGKDTSERWIHRLRLSTHQSPFASSKGVEVRIPYGIDAGIEEDVLNDRKTGIFVSFNDDYWSGISLRHAKYHSSKDFWDAKHMKTFNLTADTIKEADMSLTAMINSQRLSHLGFCFKDALRFIDELDVQLVKVQPENPLEINPPDNIR